MAVAFAAASSSCIPTILPLSACVSAASPGFPPDTAGGDPFATRRLVPAHELVELSL